MKYILVLTFRTASPQVMMYDTLESLRKDLKNLGYYTATIFESEENERCTKQIEYITEVGCYK
jgi:hypothetical protein